MSQGKKSLLCIHKLNTCGCYGISGNDRRNPDSLTISSINIYFSGEWRPQFSIFLCWWLLSWLRQHLRKGQQLFECACVMWANKAAAMELAPLTSLLSVISVAPRKTRPAQSQASHTPSAFQLALWQPSHCLWANPPSQIHHQFPAIPDEMVSVWCVCYLGSTEGSTTCWLLSSHWVIFYSWSNFFHSLHVPFAHTRTRSDSPSDAARLRLGVLQRPWE